MYMLSSIAEITSPSPNPQFGHPVKLSLPPPSPRVFSGNAWKNFFLEMCPLLGWSCFYFQSCFSAVLVV